jgi:hypothetical protein
MHPEVIAEKLGRCPKCGMFLIAMDEEKPAEARESQKPAVEKKPVVHHGEDKGLGKLTWQNYMPLIVIIILITAAAFVASWNRGFTFFNFVLYFMTGFFLVFAGFKLMDLDGFAKGYFTYDLLAQKWFEYGYIYPFIELGFGLLMLVGYHPPWLLWAEFAVMAFSGLGVAIKLKKGEKFQCACLGTFLKVPLTYVTLVEDFGMALLALVLIFLS